VRDNVAVVLGLGPNGLGSIRALARAGIRVYGVDNDESRPGARSRYGRNVIIPEVKDVRAAYREGLRRIAEAERPARPVIIPADDGAVEVLHEDRARLVEDFRLLVAPAPTIDMLMDKWEFDREMRRLGLAAPTTWLLSEPLPDTDRPLVVKPRSRFSRRGDRLERPTLVSGTSGLQEMLPRLRGESDEYVAQAMIPGADDRIEFYGACWKDGKPYAEFTGRKIRQCPRGSGSTACGQLTESGTVRGLSRKLLEELAYEGCVDVEFKRGPDEVYYVIEVNARPGLWHTLGELAGVSLPLAACAAASGQAPGPIGRARVGRRWIYIDRDLRSIREGKRRGEGGWLRFLGGLVHVRRFAVLSVTDPVPFLDWIRLRFTTRFRRRSR
jgi:predicted ATP-grasp superfamily ATP-dependent carboligase